MTDQPPPEPIEPAPVWDAQTRAVVIEGGAKFKGSIMMDVKLPEGV